MKAAVKIQAGHILSILRIYPGQNLGAEVYNPQQHLWQKSIIRGQNLDNISPIRLIRTFYLLQWLTSLSTVRWELPLHDTQCSETWSDYNNTCFHAICTLAVIFIRAIFGCQKHSCSYSWLIHSCCASVCFKVSECVWASHILRATSVFSVYAVLLSAGYHTLNPGEQHSQADFDERAEFTQ